jgi:hypothetical protein
MRSDFVPILNSGVPMVVPMASEQGELIRT